MPFIARVLLFLAIALPWGMSHAEPAMANPLAVRQDGCHQEAPNLMSLAPSGASLVLAISDWEALVKRIEGIISTLDNWPRVEQLWQQLGATIKTRAGIDPFDLDALREMGFAPERGLGIFLAAGGLAGAGPIVAIGSNDRSKTMETVLSFASMATQEPDIHASPMQVDEGRYTMEMIDVGSGTGYMGHTGAYALFGVNSGAMQDVMRRACEGSQAGELNSWPQKHVSPEGAAIALYVNLGPGGVIPGLLRAMLPTASIHGLSWSLHLEGWQMISTAHIELAPEHQDLLQIFAQSDKDAPVELTKLLHKDAAFTAKIPLPLGQQWQTLTQKNPLLAATLATQTKEKSGFDLQEDILPALNGDLFITADRDISDLSILVGVTSHEAAAKFMDKIQHRLEEQFPGSVSKEDLKGDVQRVRISLAEGAGIQFFWGLATEGLVLSGKEFLVRRRLSARDQLEGGLLANLASPVLGQALQERKSLVLHSHMGGGMSGLLSQMGFIDLGGQGIGADLGIGVSALLYLSEFIYDSTLTLRILQGGIRMVSITEVL